MRLALVVFLLAVIAPLFGVVTDVPIDLSSTDDNLVVGTTYQVPITTVESTITFTISPNKPRRVQMITKTNAWGKARATGAFSTKTEIDGNRATIQKVTGNAGGSSNYTFVVWVASKSVSDTILIEVLE